MNDEQRDILKQVLAERSAYAEFEKQVEDHPELWMSFPDWLSAKHADEISNAQAAWAGEDVSA